MEAERLGISASSFFFCTFFLFTFQPFNLQTTNNPTPSTSAIKVNPQAELVAIDPSIAYRQVKPPRSRVSTRQGCLQHLCRHGDTPATPTTGVTFPHHLVQPRGLLEGVEGV